MAQSYKGCQPGVHNLSATKDVGLPELGACSCPDARLPSYFLSRIASETEFVLASSRGLCEFFIVCRGANPVFDNERQERVSGRGRSVS